ncbi:MAG: diaminopimelate epimerase [Clostridia bacterium]|nr:diaminopimelate epimerase [Clostridia bacterium]
MRFTKMHGIGNDYLFVNCFEEYVRDPETLARQMCDPHRGAGADGLVLLGGGDGAPYAMRIFNRDGTEAEMCGNAARCIGKFLYERGVTRETEIDLETKSGLRRLSLRVSGERVERVTVDMGEPVLTPALIPVDLPGEAVLRHRLQALGQLWFITCVSMGNPHCVVFVRDPEALDVSAIGPMLEHHPLFPRRTNVEFVRVISREILQMRVWERGAGETLACGTGACAALVAAVLCGMSDRRAQMKLAGGNLDLHWNADDNHVYQTGPAAFVYEGEWLGERE